MKTEIKKVHTMWCLIVVAADGKRHLFRKYRTKRAALLAAQVLESGSK